jgi:hypothetical protein
MKKSSLLVVVAMVVLAAQTFAFDGQRHGFVLGGGLGFAPISRWSLSDSRYTFGEKTSESRPGIGLNLLIGYAIDNQNMLVYEGNATGYTTKLNDKFASQGMDAFAWYHYFGPTGKTAFVAAGIGLYSFDIENAGDFSNGLGILLGGGYEFARHWQFGGYLGFGRTSQSDVDFNHVHLNLLISTVAF